MSSRVTRNNYSTLIGSYALVTGAARGTGRACVEALVSMGAHVTAVDINEIEPIEGARTMQLDITDEKAVTNLVTSGYNGSPYQVIVNNAGLYKDQIFEEHSTDVWNQVMGVNVTAPFYISRAAANALKEAGLPGSIINMSSIGGTHAHRNCAGYCASKAAVLGLTRASALDLAAYDITVNAVCPGTVDTEMIRQVVQSLTDELHTDIEGAWNYLHGKIPLQRLQAPEDIAAYVCFLASNGARNITGSHLTIDGGETAG